MNYGLVNFKSQNILLTIAAIRDYSYLATEKNVVGLGLPEVTAMSRSVIDSAVFLRLVFPFMGGLDGEPQCSPVRYPGSPTHLVPPTRLDSGVRLIKPNDNEVIMTTKSKVAPATPKTRSRNKTNSSAQSKVIQLLPPNACSNVQAQTRRDFENFLETSQPTQRK